MPAASDPATTAPVVHLDYGSDALAEIADDILNTHAGILPDLSRVMVLLPESGAAPRLRQLLLDRAEAHGYTALLGPRISTLQQFIQQIPLPDTPVLGNHAAELMLVTALQEHPDLYGHGNAWNLADSLLQLFQAMTLHQARLPASLDDFIATLQQWYGSDQNALTNLGREARLVHTLWQAWHAQLQALGMVDQQTAYQLKLAGSVAQLSSQQHLYWICAAPPTPAEQQWAETLMQRRQLTLAAHCALDDGPYATPKTWPDRHHMPEQGRRSCSDARGAWLRAAYNITSGNIAERARQAKQRFPHSPVANHIAIFSAASNEDEAAAIDLQVRTWLAEGRRQIGIVSDNRRLSRRLRALLERSGIPLDDSAGWALSTTSAAAVIERWLETIEEDFAYQPLLDLLRSPFFAHGERRDALLEISYRLEQDIIRNENVARNLDRYRKHIRYRQRRLQQLDSRLAQHFPAMLALLDEVEDAAQPLTRAREHGHANASAWLEGLTSSLSRLGLDHSLDLDDAGRRILEELATLRGAANGTTLQMDWNDFRTWLGRTLERGNFRPPNTCSPVQLLNLQQSALQRFDALIIASAEHQFLPGPATVSPFFNDGVRMNLRLPGNLQRLTQRHHLFRALLEAAPNLLITLRREDNGEAIMPCPWVAQLNTFHELAYGTTLRDERLEAWLRDPALQTPRRSDALPPPMAPAPRAAVSHAHLPASISAYAYQQLLDCPYQFFAARCLQLSPPEPVREALQKSDYGERVHLCLQAFHRRVPGLPEPYSRPLAPAHRLEAIAHMERLAHAVFARDLEDNFQHRGWLKQWLACIPAYIDWEIRHHHEWRVHQVEQDITNDRTCPDLTLRGRLDRIDISGGQLGILDYKTGKPPKLADIVNGEAVQLPYYALLAEGIFEHPVQQVAYVELADKKDLTPALLEGDELAQLRDAIGLRLQQIIGDIGGGATLPAWGDRKSCNYCTMEGLCRKQAWDLSSKTGPAQKNKGDSCESPL